MHEYSIYWESDVPFWSTDAYHSALSGLCSCSTNNKRSLAYSNCVTPRRKCCWIPLYGPIHVLHFTSQDLFARINIGPLSVTRDRLFSFCFSRVVRICLLSLFTTDPPDLEGIEFGAWAALAVFVPYPLLLPISTCRLDLLYEKI